MINSSFIAGGTGLYAAGDFLEHIVRPIGMALKAVGAGTSFVGTLSSVRTSRQMRELDVPEPFMKAVGAYKASLDRWLRRLPENVRPSEDLRAIAGEVALAVAADRDGMARRARTAIEPPSAEPGDRGLTQ